MIRKEVHRQDSFYKLEAVNSGEASLNISMDILNLINPNAQLNSNQPVSFKLYQQDFVNAVAYLSSKLPLYTSTSQSSTKIELTFDFIGKKLEEITNLFAGNPTAIYTVNLLYRQDGRAYLNSLDVSGFNIRHFLLEENAVLTFDKTNNDLEIRLICEPFNCLVREKKVNVFCCNVCRYFLEFDMFAKFKPFFLTSIAGYTQVTYNGITLFRLLNPTINDPDRGKRWEKDTFDLDGKQYLICTEWTEGVNTSSFPSLAGLKQIVESLYPNLLITKEDGYFVLKQVYQVSDNIQLDLLTKNNPLQKIVYGAPGTGKSFGTDGKIKQFYDDKNPSLPDEKDHVFRTTFHPDSDYSTFVGCYKPVTIPAIKPQPILDYDNLVDKFKEYLKVKDNVSVACTLFGQDYHDSIIAMEESGKTIYSLVTDAYKGNTTYDTIVRCGMSAYENTPRTTNSISYKFVPQAFTKAYIAAWKAILKGETIKDEDDNDVAKPIFLVIEEINRGNCAQIFGDLFQLLDRKDNTHRSSYPIKPDTDLGDYIATALGAFVSNAPKEFQTVVNGEEMILPENLYIWATMNTSDQSLFPIDSAFKRRWDWEYVKIKQGVDKETGHNLDWKIEVSDKKYDWWKFILAINKEIATATSSDDKKLGYFFCKPYGNETIISAERFVGKVVFYLWNDVFKDNDTSLFKVIDEQSEPTFENFFTDDKSTGDTIISVQAVEKFLNNVDAEGWDKNSQTSNDSHNSDDDDVDDAGAEENADDDENAEDIGGVNADLNNESEQ